MQDSCHWLVEVEMIGKLVQFNSEYFEGNMNEHGCGLIVSERRPHPHPVLPPRLHLPLPRLPLPPRPSDDWVEVLWSDGKTYWEYVDFLKEISEE